MLNNKTILVMMYNKLFLIKPLNIVVDIIGFFNNPIPPEYNYTIYCHSTITVRHNSNRAIVPWRT